MFRFKSTVAIASLFCSISFLTAGCSGDSGSSAVTPTSPTAAPAAPTLNVAGTWTGRFAQSGESECCAINSWTATQSGANVSGPVRIDVGEGQIVTATLSGTVSGAQLTSVTFTVAAGGIPDPALAACAFSGTGNLAATTSSISGPLVMTFPPACVGDERVSNSATETWTFTLTK